MLYILEKTTKNESSLSSYLMSRISTSNMTYEEFNDVKLGKEYSLQPILFKKFKETDTEFLFRANLRGFKPDFEVDYYETLDFSLYISKIINLKTKEILYVNKKFA